MIPVLIKLLPKDGIVEVSLVTQQASVELIVIITTFALLADVLLLVFPSSSSLKVAP